MSKSSSSRSKFIVINERKPIWLIALRITLIYLVFGLAWILFSDLFLQALPLTNELKTSISIAKGFIYVLISAVVIYLLIAPQLSKLSDNEQVILESRNELKTMLYYDHLTGLNNRRKLIDRLPDYLHDGTASGKAIIFIDIDNIKLINDTMGHAFGDTLIAGTAKRLAGILRPPEEIYRIGGDEFIILVQFTDLAQIHEVTERMIELFEDPFSIDNTLLHSTISVGIALYPLHGTDPGELLKCADIAMYQSKKAGKNCVALYNVNMMSGINERMNIGEYLHDALERNELEVYYQPQISIDTKSVVSFEALLRWNNRILGRVTPDKFIGVAEETHLIIPIGEWVLREACEFLKRLHREGFSTLSISVNISMLQLLQEDFVAKVREILEETELNPHKLELEITESILMDSNSLIRERLDQLRAMGIGLALDDFGKGYSSLSYLEELPITVLKMDKLFVDRISDAVNDTSLAGNIVRIGKKLGLTVIAEGVETETQLAYLTFQQCDRVQGWIYSKALPETEAAAFTRENLRITVR
jgi:diguanylate cyclase (GGDEF)-like protein